MKKQEIQEAINVMGKIPQGLSIPVLYGRKTRSRVMYIAGLAANLPSDGNLIKQKTDKEIATTNFDGGNRLNAGRNLLVVGIRFLFDTTASVTTATATWLSAAPANFKNGEIEISQKGDGTLYEGPIGPLYSYNAATTSEEQFHAVVPFLIRPETEFFIKAFLAGATAADQAYRIELDCIEFVEENKA